MVPKVTVPFSVFCDSGRGTTIKDHTVSNNLVYALKMGWFSLDPL